MSVLCALDIGVPVTHIGGTVPLQVPLALLLGGAAVVTEEVLTAGPGGGEEALRGRALELWLPLSM